MLNLLYYIFILHQTTTECRRLARMLLLYYIFILHQTTTSNLSRILLTCCIISSFYIKPQLYLHGDTVYKSCIISSFYIKPQLYDLYSPHGMRCKISSFYIKPQLTLISIHIYQVVLYLHSTSNHNFNAL